MRCGPTTAAPVPGTRCALTGQTQGIQCQPVRAQPSAARSREPHRPAAAAADAASPAQCPWQGPGAASQGNLSGSALQLRLRERPARGNMPETGLQAKGDSCSKEQAWTAWQKCCGCSRNAVGRAALPCLVQAVTGPLMDVRGAGSCGAQAKKAASRAPGPAAMVPSCILAVLCRLKQGHKLQGEVRKPGDRWQQVKLQRAEWSRPHTVFALFGRVLYVSNLPQVGPWKQRVSEPPAQSRTCCSFGPARTPASSCCLSQRGRRPAWAVRVSVLVPASALQSTGPPGSTVERVPQGFDDGKLLHGVFDQYGRVTECHLPRNKQTGHPKGFAFIEYKTSRHADRRARCAPLPCHPMPACAACGPCTEHAQLTSLRVLLTCVLMPPSMAHLAASTTHADCGDACLKAACPAHG